MLNRGTLQPFGMAVVYRFLAIDLTFRLFLNYRLSVKPKVKNPVEKQCRKVKFSDSLPIGRSVYREEGYLPPPLLPVTINHPVFNHLWQVNHEIDAISTTLPVTRSPDLTLIYHCQAIFQIIEPFSKI